VSTTRPFRGHNHNLSNWDNNRIRTLHLTADTNNSNTPSSDTVATLAGSTPGYTDAVGTAAQFNSPYGIVYHKSSGSSSGGVLYVAEWIGARVRRILVATAAVTTVAALPAGTTNNGTFFSNRKRPPNYPSATFLSG
jgi:hypothetical protein